MAADSAVTLGNVRKVYKTAEKLFALSPSIPVAIMTFGAADMMNVPWETIVKIYAQKLGNRRFDTLEQYAKDFLSFIEGASSLFPHKDQENRVKGVVRAAWSDLYRDKLTEKMGESSLPSEGDKVAALRKIVRSDHEFWMKYPDLEGLGLDYGARVVKSYEDIIEQVEEEVFEGIQLPRPLKSDLRKTVSFMFGKEWFHPSDESGVVIAGMGEIEPFPALLHYRVGTIAAAKLRYVKADEARVGLSDDAVVVPFAQRETIDMIIDGIHPQLRDKLVDEIDRWLPNGGKNARAENSEKIDKRKEEFAKYIRDEISQRNGPFMEAVSALPRQDLAKMAEALVNLTAFLMHMTADTDETVAEPVDVAILSKGDGFIWVKHKNLVGQS